MDDHDRAGARYLLTLAVPPLMLSALSLPLALVTLALVTLVWRRTAPGG